MPLVALFRSPSRWLGRAVPPLGSLALALSLCQCKAPTSGVSDADVVVSVKDQKLGYYREGKLVQSYKISTSKFGVGDRPGSWQTPLGNHEVIAKIGHGLPKGAVLKCRKWNGEVLPPNAPGRDPIVSRIIWLSGLDADNHNALKRFIYIHGTTEEKLLGKPASFGCVRMSMGDVIDLFNEVNVGAHVVIIKEKLPASEVMVAQAKQPAASPASSNPPIPIDLPVSNAPGEIHSEYTPGRAASQPAPAIGDPTNPGKQRLLIPVGHSLGKSTPASKKPETDPAAGPSKKDKGAVVASAAAQDQTAPATPEKKSKGSFFGVFKQLMPSPKTAQPKETGEEIVASTAKDQAPPTPPQKKEKKGKSDVASSARKDQDQASPKVAHKEGKNEQKKKSLSMKGSKKEGGPETSPPSKKHKADTAA